MMKKIKLSESVYWIGVNDRRTRLFENLWPLEKGISYNSYLVRGRRTALIDTVEVAKTGEFFSHIDQILMNNEPVEFLVINHLEPDHSGAIMNVISRYPDIKIVGNATTFKILGQFYGISDNLYPVDDKHVLDLGGCHLSFIPTPMLHWPETMMTYHHEDKILFSGDAFGSFGNLNGGVMDEELNMSFYEEEIRRYYSNIVGKYWNPVQRALAALKDKDIKIIASTHGPVWRKDLQRIISLYDKWSRFESEKGAVIVFGSMYGHTEKMAEIIARALCEGGIKDIKIYDSSKTHLSYILNDIFLYKAVILGSSAYNGFILPPMEQLLSRILHTGIKDRLLGIFGSAAWGGGGVKAIEEFAEKIKWEVVAPSVQALGEPSAENMNDCEIIGINAARRLTEIFG